MPWLQRLSREIGSASLFLCGLGSAVAAQVEEPVPDEVFEEAVGVEVIAVDVAVTDKKGRPVEGLSRDDFELRIDGQVVPIANFYAVTANPRAAPASGAAPDETAPASAEGPLDLVVYLDSFYLTPQSRKRVLADLPSFFERQVADGGRIMLLDRLQTVSVLTPFTSDLDELADALARLAETPALGAQQSSAYSGVLRNVRDIYQTCEDAPLLSPCEDCLQQMIEMVQFYSQSVMGERRAAMAALGGVINALSVLEGRKALLHVSDGIQMQTGVDLFYYVGEQLCPEKRQDLQPYLLRREVFDLNDLAARANASRVTLYALEAAGLRNFSSSSAEYDNHFFVPTATTDQIRFANLQSTLFYLSDETGGKAVLNANRFGEDLEKLTDEFRTYYSLGYQPAHPGQGESHSVSVKLEKRSYQTRYRHSVLHKTPDQQLADRALGAVLFGVAENPLAAEVRPGPQSESDGGRLRVPLEVAVPVAKLTLISRDGARHGRLTVVVAAPGDNGKKTAVRKQQVTILLPLAEATEEVYRFGVNVELSPGEHSLGVGLWDDLAAAGSFLAVRVEARAPGGSAGETAESDAGARPREEVP